MTLERRAAVADGGGAAAADAAAAKRGCATLLLPTHFTAVSMWVESLRLLPGMRAGAPHRILQRTSVGYMSTAVMFGFVGFYLAAGLPPLLAAALLFLTPMSFLMSTARNCRAADRRSGVRVRPRARAAARLVCRSAST